MDELCVQRRLVKSAPELWAEVSDLEALSRHLDLFGEIRISRVEPESTVAWEGERASGTVVLDSTGWGTKVTLTAEMREPAVPEPVAESTAGGSAPSATDTDDAAGGTTPVAAMERAGGSAADVPEPGAGEPPTADPAPRPAPVAPPPAVKQGFFARLFRRRWAEPIAAHRQPEPEALPLEPPVAAPEPPVAPEPELTAAPVEPLPGPETAEPELDVQTALTALEGVLDTLGAAHHRPFSR
jgi:hypothetical protein